ncbi:MAG: hypothetical protein LBF57_04115 [Holosporaceae bacterium]|jgi:hypothetical protein|nr:hypothetical protein [Holosporaceae bacterium]
MASYVPLVSMFLLGILGREVICIIKKIKEHDSRANISVQKTDFSFNRIESVSFLSAYYFASNDEKEIFTYSPTPFQDLTPNDRA